MNGVSPHIVAAVMIVPFMCDLFFGGVQKNSFSYARKISGRKSCFAFIAKI